MGDTTRPIMQDGTPADAAPLTMQDGSPALATHVEEVQGRFRDNAGMQDAVGRLTLAGFDRAALSLPDVNAKPGATPNDSADAVTSDIDKRQLRTMGSGMAGYLGAAAAAGATIATGGAAGVAIAAAAAVGAGAAAVANAGTTAVEEADTAELDRMGAEGRLILAVRTMDATQTDTAMQAMRDAGAVDVEKVTRQDEARTAGMNAASWTGG